MRRSCSWEVALWFNWLHFYVVHVTTFNNSWMRSIKRSRPERPWLALESEMDADLADKPEPEELDEKQLLRPPLP